MASMVVPPARRAPPPSRRPEMNASAASTGRSGSGGAGEAVSGGDVMSDAAAERKSAQTAERGPRAEPSRSARFAGGVSRCSDGTASGELRGRPRPPGTCVGEPRALPPGLSGMCTSPPSDMRSLRAGDAPHDAASTSAQPAGASSTARAAASAARAAASPSYRTEAGGERLMRTTRSRSASARSSASQSALSKPSSASSPAAWGEGGAPATPWAHSLR
jgi:hypothetical protein